MITKTLNLDDAYQALFQEVNEKSNGSINVDNIEAYFGSIQEIANLDSKFLRLPLDEPLFEIDANTRKITVPNDFRSNGLSVQGDHLAEIIFFRIERYFDYKDLSTCNIEINWKMGDKEGKTKRFIQFNDVMTIDDVQSNCIIFGWPVNNIITQKSGALTFAVEFNQTETVNDETKVLYRFNTLPATINIKDGLILGAEPAVYELDADIKKSLVNSAYGEGDAAIGDLVWITGNGHGLVPGVMKNDKVILGDFVSSINLPTVVVNGEPASSPVDFYAIASIEDGAKIRYTTEGGATLVASYIQVDRPLVEVEDLSALSDDVIYYKDAAGIDRVTAAEVQAAASTEDAITAVWQIAPLTEGLPYFVKDENNGSSGYIPASDEDLAKWGKITTIEAENEEEEDQVIESIDLYIQVAKITANAAGPQSIKAQGYKEVYARDKDGNLIYEKDPETGENKLDDQTGEPIPTFKKIGNGELVSTDIVTIPHVEQPLGVNIEVPAPVAPVPEENESGVYSFKEDEIQNVIFLNGAEKEVVVSANASDPSKIGALKFVWQKENSENNFVDIETESPAEFSTENHNSLNIEEAGTYKVVVTNYQNGEMADAITSDPIIASNLAQKIQEVSLKYKAGNNGNIRFNPVVNNMVTYFVSQSEVSITIDNITWAGESEQGKLEYEWYEVPVLPNNLSGESSERVLKATGDTLVTNEDFDFILVVKNNWNGSIYSFELPKITINKR